jgi:hypothetical protein
MNSIGPADPRYVGLSTGMNQRWVAAPQAILLPSTTADVVACVQRAIDEKRRIGVRGGGNGFRDFACNPQIEALIDLSDMDAVYHDPAMRAIAVEGGTTLSRMYEVMYRRWNVTLPGGQSNGVGVGGHVCGGGFGLLSRLHGLTVDHLHAVEVVIVDGDKRARSVIATREHDDPNRELWWAHAGGGGGNFGIVTRFWFRSPGATGDDPRGFLPSPPSEVLLSVRTLPWERLHDENFVNLVLNYGAWYERHGAPDCAEAGLAGYLVLYQKAMGFVALLTQVDATRPGAERMLADYLDFVMRGTGAARGLPALGHPDAPRRLPWLKAMRLLGTNSPSLADPTLRGEYKSAYLRRNFPAAHALSMYRNLARDDYANRNAMIMALPYGGRVNAVGASDTAVAQRDSVMKVLFQNLWSNAAEDELHVEWTRRAYEDTYAQTGGVPVSNDTTDGCYVNYPDADLSDPLRNRSGVDWDRLYHKANLERLQQVKARWDPLDVFRHRQSVGASGRREPSASAAP